MGERKNCFLGVRVCKTKVHFFLSCFEEEKKNILKRRPIIRVDIVERRRVQYRFFILSVCLITKRYTINIGRRSGRASGGSKGVGGYPENRVKNE